jgi:hypothetical protein
MDRIFYLKFIRLHNFIKFLILVAKDLLFKEKLGQKVILLAKHNFIWQFKHDTNESNLAEECKGHLNQHEHFLELILVEQVVDILKFINQAKHTTSLYLKVSKNLHQDEHFKALDLFILELDILFFKHTTSLYLKVSKNLHQDEHFKALDLFILELDTLIF